MNSQNYLVYKDFMGNQLANIHKRAHSTEKFLMKMNKLGSQKG